MFFTFPVTCGYRWKVNFGNLSSLILWKFPNQISCFISVSFKIVCGTFITALILLFQTLSSLDILHDLIHFHGHNFSFIWPAIFHVSAPYIKTYHLSFTITLKLWQPEVSLVELFCKLLSCGFLLIKSDVSTTVVAVIFSGSSVYCPSSLTVTSSLTGGAGW